MSKQFLCLFSAVLFVILIQSASSNKAGPAEAPKSVAPQGSAPKVVRIDKSLELPNGPAVNRWNDFPDLSAKIDNTSLFPTVTFIEVNLSGVYLPTVNKGIQLQVVVDDHPVYSYGAGPQTYRGGLGDLVEGLPTDITQQFGGVTPGAKVPMGPPGVDLKFRACRFGLLPGEHRFKVQYFIATNMIPAHVGPHSLSIFEITDCRGDLATTFLETDKELQSIRKEIKRLKADNEKMRQAFFLLDNDDVKKLLRAPAPENRTK